MVRTLTLIYVKYICFKSIIICYGFIFYIYFSHSLDGLLSFLFLCVIFWRTLLWLQLCIKLFTISISSLLWLMMQLTHFHLLSPLLLFNHPDLVNNKLFCNVCFTLLNILFHFVCQFVDTLVLPPRRCQIVLICQRS